jgi:hypothetical protein
MKLLILFFTLNVGSSYSQKNFTLDEFNRVTNNGEKWKNNINIFLFGDYTFEDSLTVTKNIDTLNTLIESINVALVNHIDSSNSVIYFTTDDEFIQLFNWSEKDIRNSTGMTYTSYVYDKIVKSRVHIDIIECRRHGCTPITIGHEMFHMLGFDHQLNETNTILKSRNEEFTEKDKEMISLLYKL